MALTEIGSRQIQAVIAGKIAGVGWGQKFIAEQLCMPTNVFAEKFDYEVYGNEGLVRVGSMKRGLNGSTKTINLPANGSVPGVLDEYAGETPIDYRIENAQKVQDVLRQAFAQSAGMSAVERLQVQRAAMLKYNIQIEKEEAVSTLHNTLANYVADLTYGTVAAGAGGHAAVDFKATGLIATIWGAKRAIQRIFGFEPDTLWMGWQKYLDCLSCADILARITGGTTPGDPAIITDELLAKVFGVKQILKGSAVIQPLAAPGATPTSATDIWPATSAGLTYTGAFPDPNQVDAMATPTFSKMFYMDVPRTGVRYDVLTWREGNGKIEHLEVTEFFQPAIVMPAGALFTV